MAHPVLDAVAGQYLEHVRVEKRLSARTLALYTLDLERLSTLAQTVQTPLLQLPAILANPALGIVNSDVVIENGGATDGSDSAQKYLDGASAGFGFSTIPVTWKPWRTSWPMATRGNCWWCCAR